MPWRAVLLGLFVGSVGAGIVLVRAQLAGHRVLPPATLGAIEAPFEEEAASEVRLAALGELGAPRDLEVPSGTSVEPGAPEEAPGPAPAVADLPPDLEPEALPEPSPDRPEADVFLAALGKETVVYEGPSRQTRRLGYLRTGALVNRAPVPKSKEGCPQGWYRIAPEGFVCVGRTATLDLEHPSVVIASQRPDRGSGMPYTYGKARGASPPFYARLPTATEQATYEKDLASHLRKGSDPLWSVEAVGGPPAPIANGQRIPRPFGYPVLPNGAFAGQGLSNSAFSFIGLFEAEGRRWGLSTDLLLIPLDRVQPVKPSEFQGIVLGEGMELPLVFVRSQRAQLFRGSPADGTLEPERPIVYREAFGLTGRRERVGKDVYLETKTGHWLKDQNLIRVDPLESTPYWAKNERRWLDVSILNQTLVAYVGTTPVYATLVSTGKDGMGDPKTTHSTVRGQFLIHTKHVTGTMSSDEPGDEFDLRDIPYVQYFHEGYALHAAFWHDVFGTVRSHGCINLAPKDARWLFNWTDPPVPQHWHSVFSSRGTLINIRP